MPSSRSMRLNCVRDSRSARKDDGRSREYISVKRGYLRGLKKSYRDRWICASRSPQKPQISLLLQATCLMTYDILGILDPLIHLLDDKDSVLAMIMLGFSVVMNIALIVPSVCHDRWQHPFHVLFSPPYRLPSNRSFFPPPESEMCSTAKKEVLNGCLGIEKSVHRERDWTERKGSRGDERISQLLLSLLVYPIDNSKTARRIPSICYCSASILCG